MSSFDPSAHNGTDTVSSPEIAGSGGGQPSLEETGNWHHPSEDIPDSLSDQDVRAGDSLGSPAPVSETGTGSGSSGPAIELPLDPDSLALSAMELPGADKSDDVLPLTVPWTDETHAEALAFFAEARASESDKQKKRAKQRSYVFSILQYAERDVTDEVTGATRRQTMLTQKQIDDGLETLGPRLVRTSHAWHDRDRLVSEDVHTGEHVCSGVKGLHAHLALQLRVPDDGSDGRLTIRAVSEAFAIPAAKVALPSEVAQTREMDLHKGRGAAEKAFWDFTEYMTHESRRSDALPGVHQADRSYQVDNTQDTKPGKYQYGRGRVRYFADGRLRTLPEFSQALDAHMAGRVSAAGDSKTKSLRGRKLKLRRAVGAGLPLEEARAADFDAYADDLPRLRELAREYSELQGKEKAKEIGTVWRKSLVLATGQTRAGKDTLLEEVAKQLMWLARMGGQTWSIAEPAGRNTLEGVGRAEIAHHRDMRYRLLPDYDEALRYFDSNHANEAATRHVNTSAPTPRAILASSSETLFSLGYTMKRKASSEHLAELAADRRTAPKYPLDIDEFLYRVGWYVEVAKPEGCGDDLEVVREQAIVSIFRIREGSGDPRIETAYTRSGARIGEITTRHVLEPVAVIRGLVEAARFLSLSIIQERNRDVAEAVPEDVMGDLIAGQVEIEARAEQERREAEEAKRLRELSAELERVTRNREVQALAEARAVEERRRRERCTCSRYHWRDEDHEERCPLLPEDERERRRTAEKTSLARRLEAIRRNGLVLEVPSKKDDNGRAY